MEYRGRPREYFIGRYIYLTGRLAGIPTAYFTRRKDKTEVTYYYVDKTTGEKKRRRISANNPQWDKWCQIANEHKTLRQQLKYLLMDWQSEQSGDLKEISSHYKIVKQETRGLDTKLWNSFKDNQCTKEIKHPYIYKGIKMRSQFETVIASILDDMHLEFKYDVRLDLIKGTVFPDFAINMPEYDRCSFIEYLGALSDYSYVGDNAEKFEKYIGSGLYINRDILFLPGDKYYRPDHQTIREWITNMLSEISRKCVIRKGPTDP